MIKNNMECPSCGDYLQMEDSQRRTMRLKRREIFLFDCIDAGTVQQAIEDIRYLDDKSSTPITIYINSPGGSVVDGLALIDTLEACTCPIRMVGIGEIASMACAIFVVGTQGLRFVGKNTWFMLYEVSLGLEDKLQNVKQRVRQTEALEKIYDDIMISHAQIPEKEYKKAKNSELWLGAKEIIRYKIADGYYTKETIK
jgi:ATP-dependent Clp protease, protease subunit